MKVTVFPFFFSRTPNAGPGATVREPIRRFDKTEFTVWKLGAARLLLPSYVGASMADSSAEYVRPEGVDYPVARARTSPVNWRCAGSSSRSVLNELRRPPPWPPALSSTKETSARDFPREKAVSIRRLSWMDNTDLKLTPDPSSCGQVVVYARDTLENFNLAIWRIYQISDI